MNLRDTTAAAPIALVGPAASAAPAGSRPRPRSQFASSTTLRQNLSPSVACSGVNEAPEVNEAPGVNEDSGVNESSRVTEGPLISRALRNHDSTLTNTTSRRHDGDRLKGAQGTAISRPVNITREGQEATTDLATSRLQRQQRLPPPLQMSNPRDMGRLQRAYSDSLAVEAPNTPLSAEETPRPTQGNAFAGRSNAPSVRENAYPTHKNTRPATLETPNRPTVPPNLFEESVPFTVMVDLTENSSPITGFEEGVRLWQEDFAVRPEPLLRQSKNGQEAHQFEDGEFDAFPDINTVRSSSTPKPPTQPPPGRSLPPRPTQGFGGPSEDLRTPTSISFGRQQGPNAPSISTSRHYDLPSSPYHGLNNPFDQLGAPSRHQDASHVSRATQLSIAGPSSSNDHSPLEIVPRSRYPDKLKRKIPSSSDLPVAAAPQDNLHTNNPKRSRRSGVVLDSDDDIFTSPVQQLPAQSVQPSNWGVADMNSTEMDIDQPASSLETLLKGTPTSSDDLPDRNMSIVDRLIESPLVAEGRLALMSQKLAKCRADLAEHILESRPMDERDALIKAHDSLKESEVATQQIVIALGDLTKLNAARKVYLDRLMKGYENSMGAHLPAPLQYNFNKSEAMSDMIAARKVELLSIVAKAGFEDLDFLKDHNDSLVDSETPMSPKKTTVIPEYNSQSLGAVVWKRVPSGAQKKVISVSLGIPSSSAKGQQPSFRRVDSQDSAFHQASPTPFSHTKVSVPQSSADGNRLDSGANPFTNPGDYDFYDEELRDLGTGLPKAQPQRPNLRNPRHTSPPKRGPNPVADEADYADDFGSSDEEELLAAADLFEKHRVRSVLSEATGNVGPRIKPRPAAKQATPSRKPKTSHFPPELMKFPWSKDVAKALKDRFRLNSFRTNQLQAINATLAGRDTFVLMPTGGGKSLCYQLPALITSGKTHGVTIVISPLLSLMQDQVLHMAKLNITAVMLSAKVPPVLRNHILSARDYEKPEHYLQMLYITPEMLAKSGQLNNWLRTMYQKKKLARIVIDEAHCVSEWGHDFREDYKALGAMREKYQGVPVLALTATATENVIADVKHSLRLQNCEFFSQGFDRPNLHYQLDPVPESLSRHIADLIKEKHGNESGIVYTHTKGATEKLAKELRNFGIKAEHYHAAIPGPDKERILKQWHSGQIKLVVSTTAFGMGIDKPDVRYVMHHHMPQNLEGYYQETGRAGRDGLPSSCYLFFGYGDYKKLQGLIRRDKDLDWESKKRKLARLERVMHFYEDVHVCRRKHLLAYFGEKYDPSLCKDGCDNCQTGRTGMAVEKEDYSHVAVGLIRIVKEHQDGITMAKLADIAWGRDAKASKHLAGFGVAKDLRKCDINKIIVYLTNEGALREENRESGKFHHDYLHASPKAQQFLTGKLKLELPKFWPGTQGPRKRAPKSSSANTIPSTNVSSPVRESTRNKRKSPAVPAIDEDFEDGRYDDDDIDEDDAFNPVPPRHRLPPPKPQNYQSHHNIADLGSPITRDARLQEADINDIHEMMIGHFVEEAKQLDEEIRGSFHIRRAIFNEKELREMAINWTTTVDSMCLIRGIDKSQVDKYGHRFAPLVEKYQANYLSMMGPSGANADADDDDDDEDQDQDQDQDIIDLISDDEYGDEPDEELASDEEDEGDDGGEFQDSPYFALAPAQSQSVDAWRKELNKLEAEAARQAAKEAEKEAAKEARGARHRSGQGGKPPRNGSSYSRRSSSKFSGGGGGNRVAKSRSGGGGGSRGPSSGGNRGGRGGGRGGGGSRIPLMPL